MLPTLSWRPSRRILIVAGHYGSGKTNVAVNLALLLRGEGRKVTLIDFDTVNPYFRAADNVAELNDAGVKTIIPDYANTNLDLPTIPPQVYSVFSGDADETAIFDVGGDDAGASALGMFSGMIASAGYEMLYVMSMYRPLTAKPEDAAGCMYDIESASRLRFTNLVNNSNIGPATDSRSLTDSQGWIVEIMKITGLPLAFSASLSRDDVDWDKVGDTLIMRDETVRPWEIRPVISKSVI